MGRLAAVDLSFKLDKETEARRLSEKERIPIFLFTHDGNIETGRC